MSKEAVERLIVRAENAAIRSPLSKDIVFGLCRSLRALSARLAEVEAERDRQYDENVDRIAQQAAAEARAEAAEGALERDRSHVATALTAFSDAFARRSWLLEGRGPYEWDDPQYQKEFGAAYEELRAALEPLKTIARDWSNCPKTQEEVQAARMDWKARAEAAEAERDALAAKLAVAVEAMKGFESWDECWPGNINLEAECRKARSALATLTADTTPAPEMSVGDAKEYAIDTIEEIIGETHDIDVTDRRYAENIVAWLERHHPAALRALAGEEG